MSRFKIGDRVVIARVPAAVGLHGKTGTVIRLYNNMVDQNMVEIELDHDGTFIDNRAFLDIVFELQDVINSPLTKALEEK